jgi:virginiamycin B lyase
LAIGNVFRYAAKRRIRGSALMSFTRFSFSRLTLALGLVAVASPGFAQCTKATVKPTVEKWTAAKYKANGAEITIYTGPVDRGSQLQITSGIDKSLWVASTGAGAIMKFTTKGEASLYVTPESGSAPESIAPLGKLMAFTEWRTPCAGTASKTGAVTEYDTGLSETQSTAMAPSSAKLAYFATDFNGIWTISNTGKLAQISLPDEGNQITGMGPGPNGDAYFVEYNGPTIGEVTPKGTYTECNTGLGNLDSFGVAGGSDGRVWFADNGNNSIGATTLASCSTTDYTTGFTGDPVSITAGPDGNLYFGETTPVIGQITTAGKVTEYAFPATEGTFPVISLTVGPDGNIWFTNNSHSQVGMLKLPPA